MNTRPATASDFDGLVTLWYQGWHDGHAQIVPAKMRDSRTMQNFRERVEGSYREMRVVGESGAPRGFHIVKRDELAHLYIARDARGTGIAAALLGDVEEQITQAGFETAWLSCAVGNDRAGRFYEKYGWLRGPTTVIQVDTPVGVMPLDVWRYEKQLGPASQPSGRA